MLSTQVISILKTQWQVEYQKNQIPICIQAFHKKLRTLAGCAWGLGTDPGTVVIEVAGVSVGSPGLVVVTMGCPTSAVTLWSGT